MKAMITGLILNIFLTANVWAGSAVLIEEGRPSSTGSVQETRIRPLSQRHQVVMEDDGEVFGSSLELRTKRRMGVGAELAGNLGLAGFLVELNLTPTNSVITGFGGGPGYGSFQLQWRHFLADSTMSPYAGIGYARWYNASSSQGNLERSTPSVLGSRFLSDEQKSTGQFALDFLTPHIGLQYSQLHGEYTGLSFFLEVTLLSKLSGGSAAVGGLGSIFYF
ncbi:MAG: hypothetical protein COT73_07740 [Bdellovibrio sp. CG10_big_fil_rev_8_21_14_0_10_47_8]|nr:MAG: hypothetical protein COT73_07740 [Bdellovibrio sp. CG10_big_fil_rev_8_21_14_0_10_47_8]